MNEKDPKAFWKTLDEIKNLDGRESNPKSLNAWQDYFHSLLNSDQGTTDRTVNENLNENATTDTLTNEDLNKPFTCKEVKIALKALKNSKAAGIDLIKNEFFKYGTDIIVLPLV